MINKIIASISKYFLFNKTMKIYRSLASRDINQSIANAEFQNNKLFKILEIAFNDIPYYQNKGIPISKESFTYDNFLKIPILTKEIIRNRTKELINHKNKNDVFKVSSGGSTGEPVVIYFTQEQKHHGMANYYLALSLNNVNINDTSIDLWGAEKDMHNTNATFDIKDFILNKTTLNTFVLSEDIINLYIKKLNKIKPKFIKAYVHSIYEIAKFINNNKISIDFTPIIHCTTGPLYPEMRSEIKKAFNNALVYNFYGSREVSAIATEVPHKKGLFVLYDNVLVEILDENDNPVKKGQEGEVVITTLNNFYMPLIRYKIGDRAIKGDDIEFGSLILDSVVGRTLGVIHKIDGTKIDGQFFTSLFFNQKGINMIPPKGWTTFNSFLV